MQLKQPFIIMILVIASVVGVSDTTAAENNSGGTGQDESGIINAIDPDGIFVELVGAIRRRPQQPEAAV